MIQESTTTAMHQSSTQAMTLSFSFAAVAVAGACFISIPSAQAKKYQCDPFGDNTRIPCEVWVNGNQVSVGGFQAAPVFTMQSSWEAINQRGEVIKVMKGSSYTMFLNTVNNKTLRIYGFSY